MATIEEIKELIKAEVNERINVNEIPGTGNFDDYGIDSLDKSSLFMAIEDKYDISISDSDLEELNTINDILDFINCKDN